MTRKHPTLDDELRRYTEEMRELIDSTPPSAALTTAHDEVAARLDTPTGIHYLQQFRDQLQTQVLETARDKLHAERERRLAAEATIRGFWKWAAGILAGVLIIVIAALILGKTSHP
jgi:hypothetical protein